MDPYIVYAKTDEQNRIVAVNSSAFLSDFTGWVEVDRGLDDRCHHAQGNYLPETLYDDRGICRYKLADGIVQERSAEEMDADYVPPEAVPTQLDRIEAQALYTALMTDTLIEEV